MKLFARRLIESAKVNLPIMITALITTAASLVIFSLSRYESNVTQLLQLSPLTPWGVFTGIFVHSDEMHIMSNLAMLWLWTVYIISPISFLTREERIKRAKFFVPAILGSAIVVNLAWMIIFAEVNPGVEFTSRGASGLVYAFSGAALGFAVMNIVHALPRYRGESSNKRAVTRVMFSNIIVVILIFGLAMFDTDLFLSKAPGSNVFAHGLGFMFGLGAVMAREYIVSLKGPSSPPVSTH